jgi:DNA repair exonuclease SbcCD nuclease subunit
LFDIALPDLRVADVAVKALKKLRDAGIRVYVVYGSHDYSPTETSVIDVVASAGVLTKIPCEFEGDSARLDFVIDAPTGVKIAGMHARKRGLEKAFFESLDKRVLEREEGAKIFVFHSALNEWRPDFLKAGECVSAELLPKGFTYYAAGHVHERREGVLGGKEIVFSGPLSASDFRDLEELASSKRGHGLYFVELDASRNKIVSKKFHAVEFPQVELVELHAEGKTAVQASEMLLHSCSRADARGKIVLLKAKGELTSGRTSDVDFKRAREILENAGALDVVVNRNALTAREAVQVFAVAASKQELEEKLLEQAHSAFKTPNAFLREKGIEAARELLKAISREREEGESKGDYEARVTREGLKTLQVKG